MEQTPSVSPSKKETPDAKNFPRVPVADLVPYARNSRTHSPEQVARVAASIREFGFLNPVIVDSTGMIIAGHCRVMAAQKLGLESVPCVDASHLTEAQKRAYVLADNRLALDAGWDDEMLRIELQDLATGGFDLELTGFTDAEIKDLTLLDEKDEAASPYGDGKGSKQLLARFIEPPVSIIDTRSGRWSERRQNWIDMGVNRGAGRGDEALTEDTKKHGKIFSENITGADLSQTSLFDPVLCELAYLWFSPAGGQVVDPFCGGPPRGIVASALGRAYTGFDIRAEQVEANALAWSKYEGPCPGGVPNWVHDNALNIARHVPPESADFVFSCPPYADLEVYSEDAEDLSTMRYEQFLEQYRAIVDAACQTLKPNRFACFVVTELRDKKTGFYRGFVHDTVQAFLDAGLEWHNDAVLLNSLGSAALRAGRLFNASRKLVRVHQNVLTFVKGDLKKAVEACGDISDCFAVPEEAD